MALTGDADGPPLAPATTAALAVDEALAPSGLDARALADRAAHLGLSRRGATSCGGAARLLPTADDRWVAVNLPRPDDLDLLPAWLGIDDPAVLDGAVAARPAADVVGGAIELGLAVAEVGERPPAPFTAERRPGPSGPPRTPPKVVDLSSLWAGPLCTQVLRRAGAEVVVIEASSRPDGSRAAHPGFHERLAEGKDHRVLDLRSADGRAGLHDLVDGADVVVSSARARALHQLGLDPDAFLAGGRDRVWVAVTGHGWTSDRIGFGDDCAAAAGLVAWGADGRPRFAADAVADPLTGALAARAVLDAWTVGGRWFVDAALAGAAASVVGPDRADPAQAAEPDGSGGWIVASVPVTPPAASVRRQERDMGGASLPRDGGGR